MICEICNKEVGAPSQLEIHMRIHTNEHPYVCKTCGKAFAQKSNLNKHEYVHGQKLFGCEFCDKWFAHKQNLQRHQDAHHNIVESKHGKCQKNLKNSSADSSSVQASSEARASASSNVQASLLDADLFLKIQNILIANQ
ncbi:C2H2 type domain-containing protein [Hexamita inflata]|uniref:C2H2 type domain-containing protein n=1 Tax=Hexamita inflata TaxID=28002 RepID=A0AA86TT70_9EUKA|nr:C2H2 type domain-containing protein [Hexamita inflata]